MKDIQNALGYAFLQESISRLSDNMVGSVVKSAFNTFYWSSSTLPTTLYWIGTASQQVVKIIPTEEANLKTDVVQNEVEISDKVLEAAE